jgi:hypothetical protein
MTERYAHRPSSPGDGDFEQLCMKLLRELLGENPHESTSKDEQINIGDTLEGDEFKYLNNSTVILRIEIAEKTDENQPDWIPSGIMCPRKRYICGNTNDIFAFSPERLRQWRKDNRPPVVMGHAPGKQKPTIASFELPKERAREICLFRLMLLYDTNKWFLWRPGQETRSASAPPPPPPKPEPPEAWIDRCRDLVRRDLPEDVKALSLRGFVGVRDGHFVHYCHCGKWGLYGDEYHPRHGHYGVWYCREHVPDHVAPPPKPQPHLAPPQGPGQAVPQP